MLRYSNYENFEQVEEAVQTAFQRALEKWPSNIPDNPAGWLYTVARNTYLESLRRGKTERQKLEQLQPESETIPHRSENDELFDPGVTPLDDLAKMILLCCNPELPPRVQVCLTLKSACGFSVSEISRALGMQEEAVKKTITRAKAKFLKTRK
ncbi:MAG: sigma-70 family RNA polymerase sigma factor [Anaerolineae bacterium]|nr:sigma-70 family RNA polymerase sigma factor [Anaerolineae bacterium]